MVSLIPRPGIANAKDGLILAEHAGDQYTYAAVLQWAGFAHRNCGELATAEDLFRKTLNIATERVSLVQSDFDAKPGYDISRLRQTEATLEQLRRGTELAVAGLSMLRREQPKEHFFGYSLALSYQLAGRSDEALATLIPALERAEQSSAGQELALMYRLKGRLLEGKSNARKLRTPSVLQSKSHAVRAQNRLSCGRRPSSRDCSPNKVVVMRGAPCCRKSTTGSAKASTLPT